MSELEQLLAELRELYAEVQSGDLTRQWRFHEAVIELTELLDELGDEVE